MTLLLFSDLVTPSLLKAEIRTTATLTAEDMGMTDEEGDMAMSMTMNMSVYNWNEPVSIELPSGVTA
ncbi:MAG: hypothetical protein NTU41_10410 [Chloroflexi bacterium]|nr:hypothetical protein [Chloroflexota bacterium]